MHRTYLSWPFILSQEQNFSFVITGPVIKDTLSMTNLAVMIDDPVISANLAELFIQLQNLTNYGITDRWCDKARRQFDVDIL